MTQTSRFFTVIETEIFTRSWPTYWDEEERGEFVTWLAANPNAGDVIQGSGGCRKVRWRREGTGKRGGVRIIYYNVRSNELIYLLMIYAKSVREDLDAKILDKMRRAIDGEDE